MKIAIIYEIDISSDGTYSVNKGNEFLYEARTLKEAKKFIASHLLKEEKQWKIN